MKIIIIGKQGCGKSRILDILEDWGVSVGREFSNLPSKPDQVYIDPKYEHYTMEDIDGVFENKSYLYIGGIEEPNVDDAFLYYRGISFYTYDHSEVIAMSVTRLGELNWNLCVTPGRTGNDPEKVLWVWLDNKRVSRIQRHVEEHRTHSFVDVEKLESRFDADFVKNLYSFPGSNVLYFTEEEPERVATIIYSILQHPDLVDKFVENFN